MAKKPGTPIKNMTTIDMIGARKDGGVDLVILVGGKLDGTIKHQQLLLDKVERYLLAINSDTFRKDFKNPPSNRTYIVVKCAIDPDPVIVRFIEAMKPYVMDNHARIRLEVEKVTQ